MARPEGRKVFIRRSGWLFLSQHVFEWAAFALGPLIGVVVALSAGQETSWDFRNYHWYNGYSLLTLRYGQDILVAHHATYHNPGLDILYFLVGNALPPRLTLALLGAVEGLNFSLLYLIARSVFARFDVSSSRLVALTTAAIGFLGGMQGNRVKELCGEEACEEVVVPGGGFAPKAE